MEFGFKILIMYEGKGVGMKWWKVWNSVKKDDELVLGHIFIMLMVDEIIYIILDI
jgi:hypothetical protein